MNLTKVSCPAGEILEKIKELDPLHVPDYLIRDEITLGRLFADTCVDVIIFNTTARQWYVYDGIVWKEDEASVMVGKLAMTFQRAMKLYVADAVSENPTDNERAYELFVLKLGDRNKRLKMIEDAKSLLHIESKEFDKQPQLLNVRNGVINLDTLQLLDHDPKLHLSKVCDVDYDEKALPGEWENFISDVFENDREKIDYVQRLFGYSLTAVNIEEECYLFYGKSTRNGKSTMLSVMGKMLGSYAMNIEPESLMMRKKDGRTPSSDIARLQGCRFLHCKEPQKGAVLDIAQLKQFTGRDVVTARALYKGETEFVPVFKLFINSNYRPQINDMTLFTSGRIKVIEFNKHYSENEQDKHLLDKLTSEKNLSGLLNWCIWGYTAYKERGTAAPQCVKAATVAYRNESDKIQNYILDCLRNSDVSKVRLKDAYEIYKKWCTANGYVHEGKKNFKEMLQPKIQVSKTATFEGITVANVIENYDFSPEGYEYLRSGTVK